MPWRIAASPLFPRLRCLPTVALLSAFADVLPPRPSSPSRFAGADRRHTPSLNLTTDSSACCPTEWKLQFTLRVAAEKFA